MCYFVTLAVRDEGAAILAAEKQQRYGLGVAPVRNPHLASIFPPDDRLFWITDGGCSCELRLSRRLRGSNDTVLEKQRARYRERGWSEAKIERALAAKHAVRSSVQRGQREDTPLERLTDLLIKLRAASGGVRIFGHEYNGAVEDEIVTGQRGKPSTIESILEIGLPDDVVTELTRGSG